MGPLDLYRAQGGNLENLTFIMGRPLIIQAFINAVSSLKSEKEVTKQLVMFSSLLSLVKLDAKDKRGKNIFDYVENTGKEKGKKLAVLRSAFKILSLQVDQREEEIAAKIATTS